MSENLDLARSIYAAWGRGDYSSVEWAHPGIEVVVAAGPTAGHWTGLAGLAEGFGDFLSAWEDHRGGPEAVRELDHERVLALARVSARGKSSGLDLEEMHAKGASVFSFGGGEVTRLVCYFDRDRALTDLGLAG